MEKTEELAVIRRVLAGQAEAFEQLVRENQSNVYHLALKMVKNEADALDISQDAFFKAYTSLASFRGSCRFSVWLYRLTYNLCIDHLRKNARQTDNIIRFPEDGEEAEREIPDRALPPQGRLEQEELRRAVNDAVLSLPHRLRQILLLREYEQLSYDEIGDALHISAGTVKSRLARARKAAAEILIKNGTIDAPLRHKSGKEE